MLQKDVWQADPSRRVVLSVMQLRHLTGTCRLTCPRPAVPPCSVDSSSRHTGRTAWQVDSGGIFSRSRPLLGAFVQFTDWPLPSHHNETGNPIGCSFRMYQESTSHHLAMATQPAASSTSYPVSQHSLPESISGIQLLLTTSTAETRAEPYHLFLRQF